MTEFEARIARLEAHWSHADRQLNKQAEAMEGVAKALAVLTTRVEGLPGKVEESRVHDAEEAAVASERERSSDNMRQVVAVAVSIGSFVGAVVFGVLSLVMS